MGFSANILSRLTLSHSRMWGQLSLPRRSEAKLLPGIFSIDALLADFKIPSKLVANEAESRSLR